MASLTPSDVKRWDVGAIHSVFQTANSRADSLQRLGDDLGEVHDLLSQWQGEAGDAFRVDLGKARRDIEADGQESKRVAAGVSQADADIRACKAELDDIERAADANGWTVTPDWRIDVGDSAIGRDPIGFVAEQQMLQEQLNACKVHAHSADHELATAIRSAVGETQPSAGGQLPGGAPSTQGPASSAPGGKPRTWQDMLLPGGPAGAGPVGASPNGPPAPRGAAPSSAPVLGPPVPAGFGGEPPSLQDLLTGRAQTPGPGEQQPPPGGLAELLSRLHQPVALGTPPPRLNPADVDSFKAMARQTMIRDGVPPDQIDARLNEVVGRTQQWIDNGMPNYVPPEPQPPPAPGFGEGFGDRWRATEQGIENLLGQGGPGAPGVLESWEQLLQGTVETATNPAGAFVGDIQNAYESPSAAYFLGGKTADAAFALPGLLFGGEGAAVEAGLGDIGPGVLETGPAVSPHAPLGFDHLPTYNPWAEQAAMDLNHAFGHGGPTADLGRQLADMSTHYIGDNPDRVVLGKFDGQEGGYIGESRGDGGIYFDTGDPIWDAIVSGLSKPEANGLAWQVNEQFLRGQMENGVSRIEYTLPPGLNSVEEVLALRPDSFSAKEIAFLKSNAEAYGYQQLGNSWVRVTGGHK